MNYLKKTTRMKSGVNGVRRKVLDEKEQLNEVQINY